MLVNTDTKYRIIIVICRVVAPLNIFIRVIHMKRSCWQHFRQCCHLMMMMTMMVRMIIIKSKGFLVEMSQKRYLEKLCRSVRANVYLVLADCSPKILEPVLYESKQNNFASVGNFAQNNCLFIRQSNEWVDRYLMPISYVVEGHFVFCLRLYLHSPSSPLSPLSQVLLKGKIIGLNGALECKWTTRVVINVS